MSSEIRANKQTNRAGLGTVTYADTGIIVSGIVTCTELSGLTALNIAGVGTASTLDINGDIDVDGHTNLDNVNIAGVTTSTGNIYADNYFGNSGLTLNNNGNPSVNIISTSTTGSSRIHFGDPDSGVVGKIYYVHDGDYMHFNTAYGERLRITSTGKLEIDRGSASDAAIDIKTTATTGASRIRFVESGTSKGELAYSHNNDQLELVARSGQSIAMFTNGATERVRIDSSGKLGVGDFSSTSIAQALHVKGSQPQIYLEHTGGYDMTLTTNDGAGQNGITVNGGALSLAYNNKNIWMCRTGGRVFIGNSQDSSPYSWNLGLQVSGTSTNAGISIRRDQSGSGGALLMFVKSGGALNGNTIVSDDDQIGGMYFNAADGTDVNNVAASIAAFVDGTPGSNDTPGRLVFNTTADGANSPTERLRIASDGVITAQKSATFGNTSDSFTALNITSSTSGISELRFADTTANAGYVKYEHSSNNLIFASNATPRMTIQSTGIVKVESNDSSGLSAHLVVNNSESNSGLSIMGSGSSFSSGGWAAVTDAGIIRSSANSSNGLVLQAASGDLRFYAGGNPPAERFRIANDGTPTFFSPAVAWHEGPAVLEASNGYGAIFFRSTGSTHGTSVTGTWSIGKLAGTDGFGILKNGMTGGGAVRADAPLSISNAGDITIGKQLLTPKRPAFFVTMNGGDQTTSAANILPFDTVVHNEGSHYQTSGSNIYHFVCPVAGYYFFGAQVWLKHGSGTGNHARWEIWRDTTVVALAGWHQNGVNLQDMQSSASVTIYCDAGAKVYCEADYALTYWRGGAAQPHTFFHGFLIG